MPFKVEISGVDVSQEISAGSLQLSVNERNRARLLCGPGYVPAKFAPVTIYGNDGITKAFGGVVFTRGVSGIAEGTAADETELECLDAWFYADNCYITLNYASDVQLEDVLTDIVTAKLSAYGITYTPTVSGITIAAFSCSRQKVSALLRDLAQRAALPIRFTPTLELVVAVPSAAPFAVTDAAPHCSDIRWADSPQPTATTVTLLCGAGDPALHVQQWTVQAGETEWVGDIKADTAPWNAIIDGNYYDVTPVGGGGHLEFDLATSTLHPGTVTPVAGSVIQVQYWISFPFEVRSTTGATPDIEVLVERPDIFTYPHARQTADALRDALSVADAREIELHTDEDGLDGGQELTVALSIRDNLAGVFLISSVQARLVRSETWHYVVNGATVYQGSRLDEYRQLFGGGASSAGVTSGSGGGVTTVLSSPVYLGGSRNSAVRKNPAAWTPALDFVPYTAQASFTGRIRVELFARDAGVGVTARLYDVTAGAAVMTTSEVTSQAAVEVTATGAITSGHTYRLELLSDTADAGVLGIGSLEAV